MTKRPELPRYSYPYWNWVLVCLTTQSSISLSQYNRSCMSQSKAVTSLHPDLISFSITSRACTSIVTRATIFNLNSLGRFVLMASENLSNIEDCFFFRDFKAFLSPLSFVSARALVQSWVHWIWLAEISIWPGKSFAHLSRLVKLFFKAVFVFLRLSFKVALIAFSTSHNQFSTAPSSVLFWPWANSTSSPSAENIPVPSSLLDNPTAFCIRSLTMLSKHFFRCGWTASGFRLWPKISSKSSFERK